MTETPYAAPPPTGSWTGPSGQAYGPPGEATPPWASPRGAEPAGATAVRPAARQRRTAPPLQRVATLVVGVLAAAGKWGLLLLKLGKFGPMAISMVVSIGIFTVRFGFAFAVGLVGLILVHELGHVVAARIERVPASLPFFLGPFGAMILLRGQLRDARQEAVIGIGGPLAGSLAALGVALAAAAQPAGHTHDLLLALAYFGFFLNLFNLTPMLPFDGGRVAGAVSIWLNVAGVVIMAGLIVLPGTGLGVNPFLILLFIAGCITTFQRFKRRHTDGGYRSVVPMRVRGFIGLSWAALIALCAVGMNMSHRTLVRAGATDGPSLSRTDYADAAQARVLDASGALDTMELRCRAPGSPACADAVQAARGAAGGAVQQLSDVAVETAGAGDRTAIIADLADLRDRLAPSSLSVARNDVDDALLRVSSLRGAMTLPGGIPG